MSFVEQLEKLSDEQRLHFYEVLAHNLTVGIRGVWSDDTIDDAEKVERMKWINEVLHRVTAKVYVLRLKTHPWTEADFGSLIENFITAHPSIAPTIQAAVHRSYCCVAAKDLNK